MHTYIQISENGWLGTNVLLDQRFILRRSCPLKQTPGCGEEGKTNEWVRVNERERELLKEEQHPPPCAHSACNHWEKCSKEHSIRIQPASSSRSSRLTHSHTSTHILLREWTFSDSSLLGDSSPPPDPARLCCPALHTQSQPTRVTWHAAVCVCVCLLYGDMLSPLRQRYTKHSMSLWSVTAPSWPFLLIKTHPPTSLCVCVCVCGCLCLLLSVLNTNWAPVTSHSERDRCCIALVSRIKRELVWRRELWINVCVCVCWHNFNLKVSC